MFSDWASCPSFSSRGLPQDSHNTVPKGLVCPHSHFMFSTASTPRCLRRRHAPALSRRDILAKRRLYDPLYRRGGKRLKNHFEDCLKDERRRFISSRVSFRYVPGERPLRVIKAKRVRIKWRTGWPTASHIRRTIRFRPSRMTSSRTVRSFPRRIRRTWAGAVRPSSSRTPRLSRSSASSEDRKSTRLNSSHVKISYAVFCLKKQSVCRYWL